MVKQNRENGQGGYILTAHPRNRSLSADDGTRRDSTVYIERTKPVFHLLKVTAVYLGNAAYEALGGALRDLS